MEIRPVIDADYEQITELRKETIRNVNVKDYSAAAIDSWLQRGDVQSFFDSADRYKRWVAIEDEIIIGFIEHSLHCEITRLYVHKDHLRKGIGSQLLNVAEASLKKQACHNINILSTVTAKGFYEKSGYKVTKKTYYKKHPDEIVYEMRKVLEPKNATITT